MNDLRLTNAERNLLLDALTALAIDDDREEEIDDLYAKIKEVEGA